MNQPESAYCGNAKEFTLQSGATAFKITISLKEFREVYEKAKNDEQYSAAMFESKKTGNKYLKLIAFPLKPENVSDHRTHSVKLDTWKPDPNQQQSQPVQTTPAPAPATPEPKQQNDDLPF